MAHTVTDKPVILTGLRANNDLHLGNYLGAIRPMVQLQRRLAGRYRLNMFVPDLHSLVTPARGEPLYQQSLTNVRLYAAAGLDLKLPDTYVYRQSAIASHAQLAWLLGCHTYMGELSRMTQFKEKSAGQANVGVGLFTYPILMAADILLYDATYIPAGEDQNQHIELTRLISRRFNQRFGSSEKQLFTVPASVEDHLTLLGERSALRIRDLRDPAKKMSKSDTSESGIIYLNDPPEKAMSKIMSATTDSRACIGFDFQGQPGISNLLQINALLSDCLLEDVIRRWEGQADYKALKTETAKLVGQLLERFQDSVSRVDDELVSATLARGEQIMQEIADRKLKAVYGAVGLT